MAEGTIKSFQQKKNADGSFHTFQAHGKTFYTYVLTADVKGMGLTTGEANSLTTPPWWEIDGHVELKVTPDDRAEGGWKIKVDKIMDNVQTKSAPAPQQQHLPQQQKQPNLDILDGQRFKQGSIEAQQSYTAAIKFYEVLGPAERVLLESSSNETDPISKKMDVIVKLASAFGRGIRSLANTLEQPF